MKKCGSGGKMSSMKGMAKGYGKPAGSKAAKSGMKKTTARRK